MEAKKKKKRKKGKRYGAKRQEVLEASLILSVVALVIAFLFFGIITIKHNIEKKEDEKKEEGYTERQLYVDMPQLDVDLLTISEYARPGIALNEVNGIVVHYTANPGTTAKQNRDYFEGLKDSKKTKASAHFIIGLDGEIVQCIPTAEMAYASNSRNTDTIAIECCIADESGAFNEKTYESLIELTAFLMGKYDLRSDDVIRHYDITGKKCPLYFVEHPDAWESFKMDLDSYIEKNGVKEIEEEGFKDNTYKAS